MTFEVKKSTNARQYYFPLVASNGEPLATSEIHVRQEIMRLRGTHRRLSPDQRVPLRERASDPSLNARLQAALARNQKLAAEVTRLREQLAVGHASSDRNRRG